MIARNLTRLVLGVSALLLMNAWENPANAQLADGTLKGTVTDRVAASIGR